MPEFKVHLMNVEPATAEDAVSTLRYAEVTWEADTLEDAKAAVEKGIADGSIKPVWKAAVDPIETHGDGGHSYIHNIVGNTDTEMDGTGLGSTSGTTSPGAAAGTAAPTNQPQAATRFTRHDDPAKSEAATETIGMRDPVPPKRQPGATPIPKADTSPDPTRSPTPGADGVTHVPLAQRSQAVPTARTVTGRQAGDTSTMSEPHETGREREAAALKAREAKDEQDEAEAKQREAALAETTGDGAGQTGAAAGAGQATAGGQGTGKNGKAAKAA